MIIYVCTVDEKHKIVSHSDIILPRGPPTINPREMKTSIERLTMLTAALFTGYKLETKMPLSK